MNFTVKVTLTVTKTGIFGGTVTSGDGGINCGTTCSVSYNSGAMATLAATPNFLSIFIGWSPDCDAVSDTTCTVTMNGPRKVTANFLP